MRTQVIPRIDRIPQRTGGALDVVMVSPPDQNMWGDPPKSLRLMAEAVWHIISLAGRGAADG